MSCYNASEEKQTLAELYVSMECYDIIKILCWVGLKLFFSSILAKCLSALLVWNCNFSDGLLYKCENFDDVVPDMVPDCLIDFLQELTSPML